MRILALDLARLTGWAVGSPGVIEGFGTHQFLKTAAWALGEYGLDARLTFRRMLAHVEPDHVVYESPILMAGEAKINSKGRAFLEVRDTPQKLRKMYGLPFELEIECYRRTIPVREANIATVRANFLMGKIPRKSDDCKAAVKSMARRRGWDISDDNEADALAVLDYELAMKCPRMMAHLRINAGPSGRMSSSGAAVFVGSRVFFPPAITTASPASSANGSAGISNASSTATGTQSEIMETGAPSSEGTPSTSSAVPARRTWQR